MQSGADNTSGQTMNQDSITDRDFSQLEFENRYLGIS